MKWIVEAFKNKHNVQLPDRIPVDQPFTMTINGRTVEATWHPRHRTLHLQQGHGAAKIVRILSQSATRPGGGMNWNNDVAFTTAATADPVHIKSRLRIDTPGQESRAVSLAAAGTVIEAPMTGKVLRVLVANDQSVKAGDTLLIIEAMKMENRILAPDDGVVFNLRTSDGVLVKVGDELVSLK